MTPNLPGSTHTARGTGHGGVGGGGGGGGGGGSDMSITVSAASETGANGTWAGVTGVPEKVKVRVLTAAGTILTQTDSTISGGIWAVTWPTLLAGTYTVRARLIEQVTGNGLALTNYTLVVDEPPPPTTYLLTVTTSGDGGGTVTSSPAGINTGLDDFTNYFPDGTVVVLTQTPEASSTFTAWSGSGSGSTTRSVTMSADRTTDAEFSAAVVPTFTLSILRDGTGAGSVTSDGSINCPGTCSEVVDSGTVVALTATPSGTDSFAGFHEGTTQYGGNPKSFTISNDRTISATFNTPTDNWTTVSYDPCTDPIPSNLWGDTVDLAQPSRHVLHTTGGPSGGPWRELIGLVGDRLSCSACIRAELGRNERRYGDNGSPGTFGLLVEGARMRFTGYLKTMTFATSTSTWGGCMQIKQTQPYNPCGNTPMFTLQGYSNKIRMQISDPTGVTLIDRFLWTPPSTSAWIPFEVDGVWSQHSATAWTQVTFNGIPSGRINTPNLLRCCSTGSGLTAGETIPGHVRIGIYTNETRGDQTMGYAELRVERLN